MQLRSDPSRRGFSTGKTRASGTRSYVQVEFGRNDRQYVDVFDLDAVDVTSDDIEDILAARRFGKIGDLSRLLTYRKISSRLSNIFYAMQASRTDFYAYQFKPVYKYIESLRGRLLIADEVGLGKTIEAGLIWLEARARADARRLLVVCPSTLREKWRSELRNRFGVDGTILDAKGFLSHLADFERERTSFECADICSIQSLRSDKVRDALAKFEETGLSFDMVVIDEAHHLRNSKTQSHKLGRQLSEVTEAFLLLTATPVHLKSEDLFRLLSLIEPDEFLDPGGFERRLIANEPIISALNALRRIPADTASAVRFLDEASTSTWFRNNPVLDATRKSVWSLDPRNPEELVGAQSAVESLNLLGSFVTRTRKREVEECRVVRDPQTVNVVFSDIENRFYWAVTNAVRQRMRDFDGTAMAAFTLIMPQRQIASSIPAMVEHYRSDPDDASLDEEILAEDLDELFDDSGIPIEGRSALNTTIREILSEWDDTTPDSKYAALIDALRELLRVERDVKIVIFSYFRKTLAYLQEQLRRDGIGSVVIHGGVPYEDRDGVVRQFAERQEIHVLLSSEVGSEGIDLQFARVVVNYDLPWNPMKVEQRIGRLDRLGQRADKISIVNLAVAGTIEERILERLYTRIGIFERSLGDLEAILGSQIQNLALDLLRGELSPEQQSDRITQTERAIEERRRSEIQLEDNSGVFVGTSDFILERINDARRLGRWITPVEVKGFVSDYFEQFYRGTRLSWDDPSPGLVRISLSSNARNELAAFCRRNPAFGVTVLDRPLSEPQVLAFEAAAQTHDRVELLSHFHPLLRWMVSDYDGRENPFHPVSAVEVRSTTIPAGLYVFAIEKWTFDGRGTSERIAYAAVPLGEASDCEESFSAESLVQEILKSGKTWQHADVGTGEQGLRDAWHRCSVLLAAQRQRAFHEFAVRSEAEGQRRRANLESFGARKRASLEQAIATSLFRNAPERQIRGFRTRLENHEIKLRQKLKEVDMAVAVRESFEELAGGICRVYR